ncbi:hypothetical protein SAMN04488072_102310 [Lentibacillus halodurans]|uniref:Uncharacterized protein n=1 Tax=Lentibacillus halodurans TaxID=237679 RepID=A0A1I0W8Q4_9BACI|nr:hypothetical protein [Lentibacillus halodurans]SFA85072.1 hypothetical protein SAMN04488072_102310 [Lentibacillus halodurans]
MASRSKFQDPGLILTVVLVMYSAFVFVWWPTDIYWLGISLVGWFMFIGLFFWFLLAIVYVLWIENIERKNDS